MEEKNKGGQIISKSIIAWWAIDAQLEKSTKKKNNKKKKVDPQPTKKFDPLPIFVSWIRDKIGGQASADDKNRLYFCLRDYTEMRKDSKSPLNTQRKVDGLLEDLYEKSKGSLSVMCEMLITAKRRCWLSVHAPGHDVSGASPPSQGRRYEELWVENNGCRLSIVSWARCWLNPP